MKKTGKKLNTWAIKRHNYTIASITYDEPKAEDELKSIAEKFIEEKNIYNYKLKIELSYEEKTNE